MPDTIMLQTAYNPDYTYHWTIPAGTEIISNPNSNIITVKTLATNTNGYSFQVATSVNEVCPTSETQSLIQTTKGMGSALVITNVPPSYLKENGVDIGRVYNASPKNASYKYTWYKGEDVIHTQTGLTGATCVIRYEWGNFQVQAVAYNSTLGCASMGKYNVTVPPTYPNNAPANLAPMNSSVSQGEPTVTIYPNPSNGEITVEPKNCEEDKVAVHVHSTTGALVLQKNINTERATTLSLSNLPNGIYLVSVVGKNNTVYSTQRVQLTK